jgi:hypothetical protein
MEQPADQGAAAPHLQLTTRLRSQLADGGRDVTGQDGRVRPSLVSERGRGDILGPRVQRLSDWVSRIHTSSPGAGEDLVGPPAQQERIGALEGPADEDRGLIIEQRRGPSVALESAAAILVRRAGFAVGPASIRRCPCVTPSRERFVTVVSFMVVVPFALGSSFGTAGPRCLPHGSWSSGPSRSLPPCVTSPGFHARRTHVIPPRLDHCPAAGGGWDTSAVDSTHSPGEPLSSFVDEGRDIAQLVGTNASH